MALLVFFYMAVKPQLKQKEITLQTVQGSIAQLIACLTADLGEESLNSSLVT